MMYDERLRVCENRVLKKIFGPKTDEQLGSGGRFITSSFMICTPHKLTLVWSNKEELNGRVVCRIQGEQGEVHTRFWWKTLRKKIHLKDLSAKGSIILKLILNDLVRVGLVRYGSG